MVVKDAKAHVMGYFFFFKEPATPQILPSSPPRPSPDRPSPRPADVNYRRSGRSGLLPRGVLDAIRRVGDEAETFIWDRLPADDAGAVRPCPQARERVRSEEHTSELQSQSNLVCRLLLEK